MHRIVLLLCALPALAALSPLAIAQEAATAVSSTAPSSSAVQGTTAAQPVWTYSPPTEKTKAYNYLFDAFGPYSVAGALIVAGINQADSSPPEWKGFSGFGDRVGSNYGIAAIATTTRYGLAEAFREDTLYYQCECTGLLPRLRHAVISTVTSRRGEDGHRDFSVPAVVAPYAGTMAAVYGWYPDRYGYKDAFRMGNYVLLGYLAENIATEFLYGGPHSLLSRFHLNKSHGASSQDAND